MARSETEWSGAILMTWQVVVQYVYVAVIVLSAVIAFNASWKRRAAMVMTARELHEAKRQDELEKAILRLILSARNPPDAASAVVKMLINDASVKL